jgi:hypothetical protein
MDANTARFQWRLCLDPLGFECDIPTPDGILPVYFPMPENEARGLVLALGLVPSVEPLLQPQVIDWLRKRAAGEYAADAQFLQGAGIATL